MREGGVPIENMFIPIGGGDEIGASCYYLRSGGARLLLDCGLRPQSEWVYPYFESFLPMGFIDGLWDLDAVFLSHAHLDHIGALPKLISENYQATIYASTPTKTLSEAMLKITAKENTKDSWYETPHAFYQSALIHEAIGRVTAIDWNKPKSFDDFQVTFFPAGHVLGAAMVYIEFKNCRILYSGDFCDVAQETVGRYQLPENLPVDLLIMETTYRNKSVDDGDIKTSASFEDFRGIIAEGGKVLLPGFALGRAQEVALKIKKAQDLGLVPACPIMIDGFAKALTDIYEEYGRQIYDFRTVFPYERQDETLYTDEPCIIIASSGMLLEGSRSARHYSKMRKKRGDGIFFTGYLDENSPGFALFEKRDDLPPGSIHIGKLPFTAHAQRKGLLSLIGEVRPKEVILVHGNPSEPTPMGLFEEIHLRFPFLKCVYQSRNLQPIQFL